MAISKGYWEKVAEHVAQVVQNRQIEHVLHFTRLRNLPQIIEHGLWPRSELKDAEFDAYTSDIVRLDGQDDAVSVSISCYCPKMFNAKRYRSGNEPWIILLLHPSILWTYHCLFHRNGVPTNSTRYVTGKRYGGYALQELFDDYGGTPRFREEAGLPLGWPTFSDSEVQVMSQIHPSFIMGAVVEKSDHREYAQTVFNSAEHRKCHVEVHSFYPRIIQKPFSWG